MVLPAKSLLEGVHPLAVLLDVGVPLRGVRALGEDVDLDLGLGAGGADDDGGAVGQLEAEHVGAGQLHGALRAGGAVGDAAVGVVLELDHLHVE